MANPKSISTTASVVVLINRKRESLRLQNVGSKEIFIKKIPSRGVIVPVSSNNYEVLLAAPAGGERELSEFQTKSTAAFQAISASGGSSLAIFETSYEF